MFTCALVRANTHTKTYTNKAALGSLGESASLLGSYTQTVYTKR